MKTRDMQGSEKQQLLSPILRWFMFAMVLANIAGAMEFGPLSDEQMVEIERILGRLEEVEG